MKLKLEIYGALCETSSFEVNGVTADYNDFGEKDDMASDEAEDYCCGDMRFERKKSTVDILEKYKITEGEYSEICGKLEDGLSFGCCGCCS